MMEPAGLKGRSVSITISPDCPVRIRSWMVAPETPGISHPASLKSSLIPQFDSAPVLPETIARRAKSLTSARVATFIASRLFSHDLVSI
jgi:hypothetical protein